MAKILAFVGSARKDGSTSASVRIASEHLIQRGLDVVTWHPIEWPIPFADPEFHWNSEDHPDELVRKLSQEAKEADGFIWASPVYHNSYSGILKNALDALSIPLFAKKPVGLMGQGGNRTTQAVDHLRIVARGVGATAITTQVCTDKYDFELVEGELVLANENIQQRLDRFIDELVEFSELMAPLRD